MKVIWSLICVLLVLGALCLCASADYSTLPEEYVALESYIPGELGQLLPDGLFSSDPEQVSRALGELTSFAGLLQLVLDVCRVHLSDSGLLLASLCALLILCALMRGLGTAYGTGGLASLAPRICLFCAVAGAGYAAISDMVEFFGELRVLMGGMLPMMTALYVLGGNVTRASAGNALLGVWLNVCERVCAKIAAPLFACCLAMKLPLVFEAPLDLSKLGEGLKKTYTSVLGALTFVLTLCLSAQNLITGKADSVAMRSGRYAIGQIIPVVGGALSGSLDTLAAGVGLLRGVSGVCGVLLVLLLCLPMLAKTLILRAIFDAAGGMAHMLGCAPESAVLSEASSLFGYMAAAVAMCSAVFVLALGAFAACAAAFAP